MFWSGENLRSGVAAAGAAPADMPFPRTLAAAKTWYMIYETPKPETTPAN